MKKMTKKMLALLLSVIMAMPTLLVMPFSAEAVTQWTAVASSDFTQAQAVSNGSLGQVPTYDNQGSAMTWSTGAYTGNGEVSKSEDGALYVPDGYIYLSGYEGGGVPIKNSSNWRIELGFRFKNVQENGVHVTDGYHADEEHCFMKMYNGTTALSAPENALHDACYFEQNANGQCFAGNYTIGEGASNPDNAVCTGSVNLTWDTDYRYIAEFSDGVFKAYIQTEDGAYVQFINETDDENFINALSNTANVNSIKIGDDNNSAFFRSLEYRYIVFSTGVQTGNAEDRIKEAIELFETKMGGDIFTGMTDAYDAYVAAKKAYDAYKYGGVGTLADLDTYATALRKKSVAMKQWSYNGISSVTPWYANDSGSNTEYANRGAGNILKWKDPSNVASNEVANVKIDVWAPADTVLLIDGIKTPAMPIMAFAVMTANKSRYVYQLYPSASTSSTANSTSFRLDSGSGQTAWYGHNGNTDRNHDWIWSITSTASLGRIKGEAGDTSTSTRLQLSKNWSGGTRYWASMANVLKFVGNQSESVKTYNLSWYRVTGDDPNDTGYFSTSNNIHVVNYKALLDVMQSASNLNTINIAEDEYTQGGLRDLLVAYDKATAIDPTAYSYDNTAADVAAIGAAIDDALSAFSTANPTTDAADYDALRKAISAKKVTYDGGSEGYTAESWAAFAAAYEAAVEIFANIQTTGYNDAANAKDKADALNAVEPETVVEKVDTTNLETAINEAMDAIENKAMFTTASYTASDIENVVSTAKNTVWGSAANYPNAKFKLDLSDENTATVAAQFDLVKAAIFALRIDKTTTVASAAEQSMESAIAMAANYASEDYGNYADLASAVTAANSFSVTVNTVTDGCIQSKISEYKTKVRAIINAINLLRPAFDKITNGTWGSFSKDNTTRVDSTGGGGSSWRLNFIRNNNVVVFRTEYPAFTIDLGGAALEWYTSQDFDADLDSINVFDESTDIETGEISNAKKGASFFGFEPDAVSLPNPEAYPGMLSASTEENSTYTIKNIQVTSYSGDRAGRTREGEDVPKEGGYDLSYIFDDVLSSTEGASTASREGTVTTHNGTTYMTADYTVSIPRESKKTLSATTLPKLTEHTLSSNLGMVYVWKYSNTGIKWHGYGHDRNPYTQTTYVMNIAPLMELITKARAEEANEQLYQVSAWNNFTTALAAARADMDYGNMNASDIEAACQTRYTNLWNAYNTLKESLAATNSSIHTAVEADEAVGNAYKADNKDGRWSAARWAAFKDAYEAAAAVIANNGKYSDANVRNYGPDEQSAIDAYASALTTAYNELITYGPRADFTALYNAAKQIGTEQLANNTYTSSSLKAVAGALANAAQFPYLNMSTSDKQNVYSEAANVQAIADEVTAINSLYATAPVSATVDSDALAAAKATAVASIKDPDAYGNIDEIKALIDETELSEDVELYDGYSVTGIKYDTQEELNAAVETLLAGLTVKTYDVEVLDENGNALDVAFEDMDGNAIADENGKVSVDYGTRIKVYAPTEDDADWFYSYSSNTVEETASKYYTTDKWINVTVKGNTKLVVKSANEATETVKITYVNALTGKTFAVDYAAKNETYTFAAAPTLAYYTFLGYTIEEDSEDYIESITPAEDTVVLANYAFDEDNHDYFTVTIANMNGSITGTKLISDELQYNDLVELRLGDGSANEETGGIYRSTNAAGMYWINGEKYNFSSKGRYRSNEIYAWVIVKGDDIDTWDSYRDNPGVNIGDLAGIEKIVMFGDSYSFRVCENIYVIPYSEDDYFEAVSDGYIKTGDNNNASVYANDKILNEAVGEKITMIGNFILPEGDEWSLVEAGMLFKATTDGSVPEADLTLGNAGSNGIARMKSSQHTDGNQFVISVNTKKLMGKNTTITAKYCAYMIYTDGTNQYIIYSDTVTDSTVIE